MPVRILIVDDSILVRRIVRDILSKIRGVEVCCEAVNGKEALDIVIRESPDIMILDVEMPLMDGLTVLSEIKKRQIRINVIMLSVLTQRGADASAQALELGAVDVIPKPAPKNRIRLSDLERMLIHTISGFVGVAEEIPLVKRGPLPTEIPESYLKKRYDLLLIGCSTGGPPAVYEILRHIPANFPVPILIVQHMPPVFTAAFADRLNGNSELTVVEARDGQFLEAGHAYVAPGDFHMTVKGRSGNLRIHLDQGEKRNAHRPSYDVTLESVVEAVGGEAAAVIMTGMGRDGADGIKLLYDAGGMTFAQDERSSVIFGMNRRAIETGGVVRIVPLKEIAQELQRLFFRKDLSGLNNGVTT
jgi:two-component system chemotaxis response regulator CheB